MANKRIKDLGTTATSLASDDFVAVDGSSQGTRKIQKANLVNDISSEIAGTYLDEANNLSDVASKDTSKLNLEVPDVGTAPNEVPLNGQLGSMAYQSSEAVSAGTVSAESLTVDSGGSTQPTQSVVTNAGAEGSALELRNSAISADTATALTFTNSTIAGSNYGKAKIAAVRTNEANGNTDVVISTSSSGSLSEAVTIDSSGNLTVSGGRLEAKPASGTNTGSHGELRLYGHESNASRFAAIKCFNTGGTDQNALSFYTSSGGTETQRVRIDEVAGDVEVLTGNVVIGTSGKGIDFGSGASTTLDEYERGTVTATDQSGAGLTLASNSGTYIKVGGQVTVWCAVQYPTTSDTSQAVVGGLPVAIGGSASDRVGGIAAYTTHNGVLTVLGDNSVGKVRFFKNGKTAATNAELSGKHIWFKITYDIS